ncbi:hypothetical protein GCM10023067_28070 [Aminobacter aganoensis]
MPRDRVYLERGAADMRYDPHHGNLIHPPDEEPPGLNDLASGYLADDPADWTDFLYLAVTFGTASGFFWLVGY